MILKNLKAYEQVSSLWNRGTLKNVKMVQVCAPN